MVRVLIISNSPAVRTGLQALLAAEEDFTVTAAPPEGLVGPWPSELPAVLVVDGEGEDGLETEALLEDFPGARLILLGTPAAASRWLEAVHGQAWGYLQREAGGPEIAAAVRAVAGDLVVLDPTLAGQLVVGLGQAVEAAAVSPAEDLSPREREVLALIAEGLANKSIAARLYLSEHTVKFHVASILAKLGASSRTDAIRLGARRGLVVL
jgi:DNA-binding NarL/FixJ family response regulator